MNPRIPVSARLLVFAIRLSPILILLLGAGHLLIVLEQLNRPLYGLTVRIAGREEPATLDVQRTEVNLRDGSLHLLGAALKNARGKAVVFARNLRVTLPVPWTQNRTMEVVADGGGATIVRLPDGSVDLLKLLPPIREEKPSETPYFVRLSDFSIRYREESGTETSEFTGEIRDGTILGAAGEAVGTLFVSIPKAGDAQVQFESDPNGLSYLETTTNGLDVAALLPAVQKIREWPKESVEPIRAERAIFRGSFATWRGDGWRWVATGRLETAALAYGRYRVRSADIAASADSRGAVGRVVASDRGTEALGDFAVAWSPFQLRFDGEATARDPSLLREVNGSVPNELTWSHLTWRGSLLYQNSITAYGSARAQSVRWGDTSAHDAEAQVVLSKNRLRLYQIQSRVAGGRLLGDFALDLNDLSLRGFARLESANALDLPYLPAQTREHLTRGRLDAEAIFTGSLKDPTLRAALHGTGELIFPGESYTVVDQPEISAVLTYRNQKIEVESLLAGGRSGSLVAEGIVDFSGRELDLHVRAGAIDLLVYPDSPVFGTGYADLSIRGSWDSILVEGPVELYGVGNSTFAAPIVTFDASFEPNRRIALQAISVRQGASELTGSLTLTPASNSWALAGTGSLRNVSLSAATNGEIVGLADGTWSATGTLQEPRFEGALSAESLFVRDLPIERVRATGSWEDGVLRLNEIAAAFAGGSLTASGQYSLEGESSIELSASNIDVSRLSGLIGEAVLLEGTADAQARLSFLNGASRDARASLDLTGVGVNGQPVGNGGFEFALDGSVFSASGSIGSLEGYFILDQLRYSLDTGDYSIQAAVLNLPATAARAFAQRNLSDLSAEAQDAIGNLDGLLTINIEADGKISPDPEARRTEEFVANGRTSIEVSNLAFRSEPLGKIRAEIEKSGVFWRFTDLTWTEGPIHARLLGSAKNELQEGGDVALDLEISGVRLDALSRALTLPQPLAGTADLVLSARGRTESPVILASLDASGVAIADAPPFDLSLVGVRIEDGAITLDPSEGAGYLNLRSFQARLEEAQIPFRYPLEFPEEPLYARISIPERDLNAVSDFFGGLDTAVTSGRIHEGKVLVSGTLSNPTVTGDIEADAAQLAFAGLDQIFHAARLRVQLNGVEAAWNGEMRDDSGGTLRSDGSVDLSAAQIKDAWLRLDGFHFRQEVGDRNRFSGSLAGTLSATGSLREPQIRGTLTALSGSVELAGGFPASSGPLLLPIHPTFDVRLEALPFRFASGPLKANVTAQGSLTGTLNEPEIRTEFQIQEGSLALPTTDLRFSSGSRATLVYAPAEQFESQAKLDVVLYATTRVTASNGLNVQRYLINLTITGDALSQEDFNILATSDPPDLTRDQILAILGQQQLFEDVAGAALGGFNSQLTQTIGSVIAPVLARSVTRSLERSLGLDYLAFDIRPGSPTTVTLIKTLGSGFSLEYRRTVEVFQQTGEPLEEIGLTYVPRIRNPILGRVRISVVGERDGIVRLSIGYWQRF